MRRVLFAVSVAAALVLLAGSPAPAQSFVRYLSFDVQIDVRPDGTLVVHETTDVDFGGNERHGIIRSFPVKYRYDDRYDRVLDVDVVRVTRAVDGGEPAAERWQVEEQGADLAIRIGHPDRTITGPHRYEVEYVVRGAMNSFDTHEELFWNVTGDTGEGAFGVVRVDVTGPAPVTQARCFAGPTGSDTPCERGGTTDGPSGHARFTHSDIGSATSGGMSVVVGFPPGSVDVPPPILEERWSLARAFSVTPFTVAGGAAVALGVVVALVAALRRGRDQFSQTTAGPGPDAAPVQFRPPEGLSPAHLGLVKDERVDPVDVGATIVDLAVRGHVRIEDRREQGVKRPEWFVVRRDGATDALRPFEERLLDGLMDDGARTEVGLADLKGEFHEDFTDVADLLYDDVVARQWFPKRPDRVRTRWLVGAVVAMLLAVGLLVLLAVFTHWALVAVPLALGALALLIASRWMPARTHHGAEVLTEARGFKRYLETAEAEEMAFATDQGTFLRYLPYAVAFGVVPAWSRAFAGLDLEAVAGASGWLYAPYVHSWNDFGSEVGGLGPSMGSTLAQAPASSGSSGFGSGGGFSGGGFGGGGTSSW